MFYTLLYIYTLYKQKANEGRLEAGRTEVMSFSMEKQIHLIQLKKHTMFNKSPEISCDPSDNLDRDIFVVIRINVRVMCARIIWKDRDW